MTLGTGSAVIIVSLTTLGGLLVAPGPAYAAPAAPAAAVIEYVALGDSYSSGTGASSYLGDGSPWCRRSNQTYSYQIVGAVLDGAQIAEPDLKACHSAEIGDFYDWQYLIEPPQLAYLSPQSTYLVTATIGGNDLGFAPKIAFCVLANCAGPPLVTPGELQATRSRLIQLYRDVRSRMRPDGLLAVLSYPAFLPNPDDPVDAQPSLQRCLLEWLNLSTAELRALYQATAQVSAMIADAVAATGDPRVRFVDVLDSFRGHRVCSAQPWSHGVDLNVPESFHPKDPGYQAMAGQLAATLGLTGVAASSR